MSISAFRKKDGYYVETDNFIIPNGILKELSFPLLFKPFAGILRLMRINFLFVLAFLLLETKRLLCNRNKVKCRTESDL